MLKVVKVERDVTIEMINHRRKSAGIGERTLYSDLSNFKIE